MPTTPGNLLTRLPNSSASFGADTFGLNAAMGAASMRATMWERLIGVGPATVNSAILVPTAVRLSILGFAVHAPLGVGVQSAFRLEATPAGNSLLAVADAVLGTFVPLGEPAILAAGAVPSSASGLLPSGMQAVTSEGDGTQFLFRVVGGAPPGDGWNATVFFGPFPSKDLPRCQP
jgi:hypothetical protein